MSRTAAAIGDPRDGLFSSFSTQVFLARCYLRCLLCRQSDCDKRVLAMELNRNASLFDTNFFFFLFFEALDFVEFSLVLSIVRNWKMQASFAALSERGFSTRISEATSFCCLDHVRAAPASCRVVVMSALCNGLVHRTKLESSFLSASSRAFLRRARPSWARRLSSGSRKLCVVVATAATEIGTFPSLNDLPLINYISQTGRIQPPVEAKTAASIFAVYDKNKKIQVKSSSANVGQFILLVWLT